MKPKRRNAGLVLSLIPLANAPVLHEHRQHFLQSIPRRSFPNQHQAHSFECTNHVKSDTPSRNVSTSDFFKFSVTSSGLIAFYMNVVDKTRCSTALNRA